MTNHLRMRLLRGAGWPGQSREIRDGWEVCNLNNGFAIPQTLLQVNMRISISISACLWSDLRVCNDGVWP